MQTPRKYQEECIEWALQRSGALIDDACGVGKTLEAIEVCKRSRSTTIGWKALVICPPTLIPQWERFIIDQDPDNAHTFFPNRLPYDFNGFEGWTIISIYDLADDVFFKSISNVLWDVVVIDEAHRIKNRKAETSARAKQIPRARSIALTGTAFDKTPAELWSIIDFIRPDAIEAFWTWARKWLDVDRDWLEHWVVGGPLDPQGFGDMLKEFMIRRTMTDVLPELPEKIVVDTYVPMSDDVYKAWKQLHDSKDLLVQVADKELIVTNTLIHILRAQQLSSYPALLGLSYESTKLSWLKTFHEDHPEPTIVFSRFREVTIDYSKKFSAPYIVGKEQEGLGLFLTGKADMLFGTIDAMGEGLNLQRAKYAIFLDAHWSSIKMAQAMDRIYRADITEPKILYMLHSCKEDELVLDALEKKMTEQEMVYFYLQSE